MAFRIGDLGAWAVGSRLWQTCAICGRWSGRRSGGPVGNGGMAFAATVDLPIIDIAWGGHLVTFDTSANPQALDGLGLLAIAASGMAGCSTEL